MKKICVVLLFMCICTSSFIGCTSTLCLNGENVEGNVEYNYDEVKDVLIRFHVLANSDSEEDQNLKLKVRDKIIEYLYPYLNKSKSLEESRQIILDNKDKVKAIAEKVIKDNKYNYTVRCELSKENFPKKSYGNIVLPQGEYEAFRVLIGKAEGKNWWCVMFPPLCFVDVTKGKVEDDKCKEKLDNQIEESKESKGDSSQEEPVIKFKIFEFFKELFQ